MRAKTPEQDARATRISDALRLAADKREELARLKAQGLPGAGAEVLCNGAMRHAIRLSLEHAQARRGMKPRPLSRRQLDKVMRLLSRRRFADGK